MKDGPATVPCQMTSFAPYQDAPFAGRRAMSKTIPTPKAPA